MIEPMLAVPLDKVTIVNWQDWAVEEKFDGHRLIVQVTPAYGPPGGRVVSAWTRPRKHAGSSTKTMASKTMPAHLVEAFKMLPHGTYDGELLGGDTSTDVTRTDMQAKLRFVVFDLLELNLSHLSNQQVMHLAYTGRRALLEEIFSVIEPAGIVLAESRPLTGRSTLEDFVAEIWKRGGEGAMLKRRAAPYQPGKRSKDVVKVKKLQTEVMKIVGWARGKGEKVDRGPYAMTLLTSLDGKRHTSVKTLDDAELAGFADRLKAFGERTVVHPDLGRHLRIEFQDWTPKGGYRHPRWDRWENE